MKLKEELYKIAAEAINLIEEEDLEDFFHKKVGKGEKLFRAKLNSKTKNLEPFKKMAYLNNYKIFIGNEGTFFQLTFIEKNTTLEDLCEKIPSLNILIQDLKTAAKKGFFYHTPEFAITMNDFSPQHILRFLGLTLVGGTHIIWS